MDEMAKAPEPQDVVLPVTREWRERVLAELARSPRGEHARLARAIHCSTGTLSELLSDGEDPRAARYSRYVEPINEYFKWPSMMPLSQDSAEIRHVLEGLTSKQLELVKALEDQPDDVVDAMLLLVQRRSRPPDE